MFYLFKNSKIGSQLYARDIDDFKTPNAQVGYTIISVMAGMY